MFNTALLLYLAHTSGLCKTDGISYVQAPVCAVDPNPGRHPQDDLTLISEVSGGRLGMKLDI